MTTAGWVLIAISWVMVLCVTAILGYERYKLWAAVREEAWQQETERRLLGKTPKPKHRGQPAPARVRAARLARSHRWSP